MKVDDELRRAAREHQGRFEHVLVPDLPRRSRHRGRVAAIAAVAAILVVVVVVAAIARRSPDSVRVVGSVPTGPSGAALRDAALAATPVLAPAGAPSGETLLSATSTHDSDPGFPTQLFGTAGADGSLAPGLLLEFQPNPPGGSVGGSATTQVRGVDAALDPPKDAAAADGEIRWVESGADITAIFRGVTSEQAIAVLDALQPRSSNLLEGFDPGSAPAGYGLLGERMGHDVSPAGVDGVFMYASNQHAKGAPADLEMRTFTRFGYPGYFRTWIGGGRDAQGLAVQPDAYGPYHLFTVAWPDGRAVIVRSTAADASTLEQIARNVQLVSGADAHAIVDDLDRQLAALPTLAAATTPTARFELHGDATRSALCQIVADAPPVCRAAGASLDNAGNSVAGSSTVDTRWLVWAAAPAQAPAIGPDRGAATRPPFTTEVATLGQWKVAVANVPAGVDRVRVDTPAGPNQFSVANLTRPSP